MLSMAKEKESKKECDSCSAHLHDEGANIVPSAWLDTYAINTILRKLQKSGHTRAFRRKKNRSQSFLSIVAFWNG